MPGKSGGQHSTLHDVAQAAGVSVSTAARVLRGSDYPVADELQQRVRAAAERLRYVPNLLAKRLRGGAHPSIGLIVGNMLDPYFGEIAQAVTVAAQRRSLLAIVANMQRDPQLELGMIRELWEHRVNGLILAGGGFDQITHKNDLASILRQVRRIRHHGRLAGEARPAASGLFRRQRGGRRHAGGACARARAQGDRHRGGPGQQSRHPGAPQGQPRACSRRPA